MTPFNEENNQKNHNMSEDEIFDKWFKENRIEQERLNPTPPEPLSPYILSTEDRIMFLKCRWNGGVVCAKREI